MPERIPQSVAIRVPFQAFLSADHITPATGQTLAVTISKNGAGYGNPSAGATNATEIGSGSYYVDLSTTDTGTVGPLFVLFTATGVDPGPVIYDVAAAASGSQVTIRSGTCQAGSAVGTIVLDASASATNNLYVDELVVITGGTGVGQTRSIQSYVGSTQTATIFPNWNTTPDNTSTFTILPGGQADVGNWLNGTIPAVNVTGIPKVDLVYGAGTAIPAGAIPNAVAGASGGLFVAGTNDHCTITNALLVSGTTTLTGAVAANGGVTFTSSTGDGFVCSSTGSNGIGLSITGNGSGPGLSCTGGLNGDGADISSGSGNGVGMFISGVGHGLKCVSITTNGYAGIYATGTYGAQLIATGAGKLSGLYIFGSSTGHDISLAGDGLLQGDIGGRLLGNTATAFSGVGVQPDMTMANGIETGITLQQALRAIGAATAGTDSGAPGSPVFNSMGGSTVRITAMADSSGNRSSVVLTL